MGPRVRPGAAWCSLPSMGFEYKIRFRVPSGFSCEELASRLPDAGAPGSWPAYDYTLEPYGFSFLDHGRSATASIAFRQLVDEALRHAREVVIEEV